MDGRVVRHDSWSACYRNPFGAVKCNTPVSLKICLGAKMAAEEVSVRLWQEEAGETLLPMHQGKTVGTDTWYHVEFTPKTPGLIWYYFIIQCNCSQIWYYGNREDSLGGEGNLYSQPPGSYQITVYHSDASTPAWLREGTMYQIFVDRFCNGNDDGMILNPRPGAVLHSHWDNIPFYVRDPATQRILYYDFFGGNLAGVRQKLPYLKDMGVTIIYCNPVFEAVSNHKYDTGNYKEIDPMFGDEDSFEELCKEAESMGISIILDGVFSHTGSDSLYFNQTGRYSSLGAAQSKDSPYYKWYRFLEYPSLYEAWWGIDNLPNVNELEPSYLDYIIRDKDSVIAHWMKRGVKGWRLDVADELPDEFLHLLHKRVKEIDPEGALIGEVWEDASRKVSYGEMREYFLGKSLDGVTNYPFRDAAVDFLLGRKSSLETVRSLMSLKENYPKHNFYALMNLAGTHDTVRILTILGQGPEEGEMGVGARRVYRLPGEKRQTGISRLRLLSLWQMTFPGVPCVYYGDEAGMEGYADPFNRGSYPWGKEDVLLQEWYRHLMNLRKQYKVLQTGDWLPLDTPEDVLGYVRVIEDGIDVFGQKAQDNVAVILINRGGEEENIELDISRWAHGMLYDALEGGSIPTEHGRLSITIPPAAGKLLLAKWEGTNPQRKSGILLHPTSLPSPFGIGDMGDNAYRFVDFLRDAGQRLWQILPLNPVGFGESPYQCLSAFAGNPMLISPEKLREEGWLTKEDLENCPAFPLHKVDYEKVKTYKEKLLRCGYIRFSAENTPADYRAFLDRQGKWLEDYAFFMALKDKFPGVSWNQWPVLPGEKFSDIRTEYRKKLADEINYHCFLQYVFFRQWRELKEYANQQGIRLIGDVPIFVSYDSSDVWAHPELFQLDEKYNPKTVAGVPPDYFSETGQLWGNPHYCWKTMAQNDYEWWRDRFAFLLEMVDVVRVDHFRGFEGYWEVPAGENTAINGQWVKGPGADFFRAIERHMGKLPIIAEDLGIITPEVNRLKNQFQFPGMKVLHFTLPAGGMDRYAYPKNSVVYTGTHDNDTTVGWIEEMGEQCPAFLDELADKLGIDEDGGTDDLVRALIDYACSTHADTVIIPLQDVLGLGAAARMNFPGTVGNNWGWRFSWKDISKDVAEMMQEMMKKNRRISS